MDESFSDRQKRFLLKAFEISSPDYRHFFQVNDVADQLGIAHDEANDTHLALLRAKMVEGTIVPKSTVPFIKSGDEAGRLREITKHTDSLTGEIIGPPAFGAHFTPLGRETVRHIRDESTKEQKSKYKGWVKDYLWPIFVAIVITWLNNHINGTPQTKTNSEKDQPSTTQTAHEVQPK